MIIEKSLSRFHHSVHAMVSTYELCWSISMRMDQASSSVWGSVVYSAEKVEGCRDTLCWSGTRCVPFVL